MIHTLQILDGGLYTTVQDLGRPGHRSAGVAAGGAVDPVSLRIANTLVGNDESAACLECALVGPTIRFSAYTHIAFVGAESSAIPEGLAIHVRAKTTIRIGALRGGAYGYLAIRGGINVPAVLGSRSTDTRVGVGGYEGRRLQRGDVLRLTPTTAAHPISKRRVHAAAFTRNAEPIRILPGSQSRLVDSGWLDHAYRVSPQSDRMGLRLEGRAVASTAAASGTSSFILPGTIQLPPSGQPIILLADAQTLGGYPQIGHVIEADLPRLAQCRPGSELQFAACSIEVAHGLLRQRERKLALLRYSLSLEV